jgi:hypothetical protein
MSLILRAYDTRHLLEGAVLKYRCSQKRLRLMAFYQGELSGRLRHGRGVYSYDNACFKYDGDWQKGLKHGQGTFTVSGLYTYHGDFVDGEITGNGTKTWLSGAVYKGQFEQGEMQGRGCFTGADGYRYDGDFRRNLRSGQGTLQAPSGDRFTGSWANNKLNGRAVYTGKNGESYDGEWKDGCYSGSGELRLANGDKYVGEFVNGKRNGRGRLLIVASGAVLDCLWTDDQPAGAASKIALVRDPLPCFAPEVDGDGNQVDAAVTQASLVEAACKDASGFYSTPVKAGDALPAMSVILLTHGGNVATSNVGKTLIRYHLSFNAVQPEPVAPAAKAPAKGAAPPPPAEELPPVDPGETPTHRIALIPKLADGSAAAAPFPPQFTGVLALEAGLGRLPSLTVPDSAASGRYTLRVYAATEGNLQNALMNVNIEGKEAPVAPAAAPAKKK